MPLAIVFVINQTQETLDDPDFVQRWEMIYKSYKRDNQLAIAFDLLFCLRRVAFVYSIFAFQDYSAFQIISLLMINLLMTIYSGKAQPFRTRSKNRMHLFNEYQLSVICYFMVVFTDFVNVTGQYEKGFIVIGLVSMFLFINMSVVL